MNALELQLSPAATVIAVVVMVATLGLAWTHYQRGGRRKHIAFLEIWRILTIAVLGFTLLRPESAQTLVRMDQPVIGVLVDQSRSMDTQDIETESGVLARATWIDQTIDAEPWSDWTQTARVAIEPFSAPSEDAPVEGTDINSALNQLIEKEPNLRAVLALTDGDWNLGASPVSSALRYRSGDIPVFSIVVGRESPLPDLSVNDVKPPTYGLLGEQIAIPFRIESSLTREVATSVRLESAGGELLVEKPIVIEPGSSTQDAILWYPEEEGLASLKLSIPVEEDELLEDNNVEEFEIRIRMETLQALVVDSLPRWEYRYLRNALERDPGVEMRCILFHPNIGLGGGRGYLNEFPSAKDTINAYDVIFLGDVGIGEGELTIEQAELIKGWVEQQAGGIVFVPGRRGRIASLVDTPLEELLPVTLDLTQPKGIPLQNETPIRLTTKGSRHLLTRFENQETANAELWENLPGFFWSASVEKTRPGSEALAVHGSLRNEWGRLPMLVTRPFGAGNALFMGTDSAWRWRRGVEDKYHYRLWSQVVRWMAHKRNLAESIGVRVTFSPEAPTVGDTVFLQASVADESGFPIERGTVRARLQAPSGAMENITLGRVDGGWGVFQGEFEPSESGPYSITVESPEHNRSLETELRVSRPTIEKLGKPINARAMREVASMTGGRAGTTTELPSIINEISALPEQEELTKRVRLWSHPAWGGLALFMLAVYWTGRKLTGMV